jgi:hypothetical protein
MTQDAPRRVGSIVLTVVFVLLGAQALIEAAPTLGRGSSPVVLGVLQSLVALSAFAAGYGAWHRSPWGPWAAVSYGAITGTMVVLLGRLLDLPSEAHRGLLVSGVLIFAVGLGLGWYLHVLRRSSATSPKS